MTEPGTDRAALVARLGDALGTATLPVDLMTEMRRTVADVRRVFGSAACSVALVIEGGTALRFAAADGAGAEAIMGVTLPMGRGIVGWVAISGEPVRIADVGADTRFARDVAESTDYVPTAILAAPIVDNQGSTVGVIEVLDPTRHGSDTSHDLAILEVVAAQLAAVIRLAALYEALGSGLLRLLSDPEGAGAFDEALLALGEEEGAGDLVEVAVAFRRLAGAGTEAARLAGRMLVEVADFAAPPDGARR